MRRIVIDTDSGAGDSIAILCAASTREVEIAAITTTYGAAPLLNNTHHTLALCQLAGLRTRVAAGAEGPMVAPPLNLGARLPTPAPLPPSAPQPDEDYAWDALYQEAKRGGEFSVITLGPLTNLAIALLKYEDLAQYISDVVVLGGTVAAGDIGPVTETNMLHDPHACEVVLHSGLPIKFVGLNASEQTRLFDDEWNHIFSRRTRLQPLLRDMLLTKKHEQNQNGEPGLCLPAAAAMLAALEPLTASFEPCHITCETNLASPMCGRTVADLRPYSGEEKNAEMAVRMDKTALIHALDGMLEYYARLD